MHLLNLSSVEKRIPNPVVSCSRYLPKKGVVLSSLLLVCFAFGIPSTNLFAFLTTAGLFESLSWDQTHYSRRLLLSGKNKLLFTKLAISLRRQW